MWTTPFPGEQPGLWCAAGSIFVERASFAVERRDAKNGSVLFSAKLSDKIAWVAASASCVRFASANGAAAYFDLAGAPTSSCTPIEVLESFGRDSPERPLHERRARSRGPQDGRRHAANARRGDARGQARVADDGRDHAEIIDPAATLTPDGVFVFGKKPGDPKIAAYALVRADGTVAFQKEDATLGVDSAGEAVNVAGVMATTGGLVVLASGQGCANRPFERPGRLEEPLDSPDPDAIPRREE